MAAIRSSFQSTACLVIASSQYNLRCRAFEQCVRELARRVRRLRTLPEFASSFFASCGSSRTETTLHRVLARFGSQGHVYRAALSFRRSTRSRVFAPAPSNFLASRPSRSLPVQPRILCSALNPARSIACSKYPPSTRRKSLAHPIHLCELQSARSLRTNIIVMRRLSRITTL